MVDIAFGEQLAYTAGIFDGEGCITINKPKSKGKHFGWRLSIVNTNEWIIMWLEANYGGHIFKLIRPKPNKPLYQWRLSGNQAMGFLELVLPYLHIKRQQAEIAINYQKRRKPKRLNQCNFVQDEADHILMASLNKKGVE